MVLFDFSHTNRQITKAPAERSDRTFRVFRTNSHTIPLLNRVRDGGIVYEIPMMPQSSCYVNVNIKNTTDANKYKNVRARGHEPEKQENNSLICY